MIVVNYASKNNKSESNSVLDVSLSLGVLILNLVESLLNHLLELGDELELLSSGLGGVVVLVVEGRAESSSLVPKLLVSLELVAGGLGDGGLSSDALGKVIDFLGESFSLGSESLEVVLKSLLLLVEGRDGLSVEGSEVFIGELDVLSQGLKELSNSLEGRVIESGLVGSQLSEGSEDGGVEGVVVLVGGMVDHLLGDLGELNETGTSLEDGSEDILGLLNGVHGILVVLGSSVGEGLLGISHGEDDSEVLLVGEGLLLVDVKLVLGSDLLGLAALELGLGVTEDVGGVLDLTSTEDVFRLTLGLLGVVDLVVVDLLGVDGISEVAEDVEDSIKGALGLELVLDLHHDVHDASLLAVVEGESLSETGSVDGNQGN